MNYDINAYVDCRLDEWAEWYIQHGDLGLGYPRKSLEGRLMDSGGIIAKVTIAPELMCNAEAEEIEQMVLELNQQNAFLAQVLREQYFGKGVMRSKAERMRISCVNFRVHLKMAKLWLAGRLSVGYARSAGGRG